MAKLKSLEEHDAEARARQALDTAFPKYNGISCPTCGSELVDSHPMETLTTDPPMKAISCPMGLCGFRGTRLA